MAFSEIYEDSKNSNYQIRVKSKYKLLSLVIFIIGIFGILWFSENELIAKSSYSLIFFAIIAIIFSFSNVTYRIIKDGEGPTFGFTYNLLYKISLYSDQFHNNDIQYISINRTYNSSGRNQGFIVNSINLKITDKKDEITIGTTIPSNCLTLAKILSELLDKPIRMELARTPFHLGNHPKLTKSQKIGQN